MGKVEYDSVIRPTKFEHYYEMAEFLAKSIWWDREFAGLKYDHKEWAKVEEKVWKEKEKSDGSDIFFFDRMRKNYFEPFWEKQLKENYEFPLYFERECTYADGRSTYYKCTIYNREEYINRLEQDIEWHKCRIKKLQELQKNA